MVHKADQNEATPAQDPQVLTDDATAPLTVDGCICSQCYKPLKVPSVTVSPRDRYGTRLRHYNGFCFHCEQGCIVIQFERDSKWLIHSFNPLRYESGKFAGIGDWIVVNPLPEPPAVLIGPGGDYDKPPDPSYDPAISAIQGATSGLMKATNKIGELLKAIEKLRHNEPNHRKH